jgi:threonine/homoserine/homoserine lactone efflux protein
VPSATTYAAFLAAVLTMQLLPGPEIILIVSRGIGQGRRVAFWTALGMALAAGAIQVPLLAFGVASVVVSSPLALEVLRWAGAAYLTWLGARLLLSHQGGAGRDDKPAASPSVLAAMREGLVVNLTSPNPLLFMLAFLPQFVDPARGSVTAQLLVLGATQKATGFAVRGAAALAAGAVGSWLARRPGLIVWQKRFAGAAMIALGLLLPTTGAGVGRQAGSPFHRPRASPRNPACRAGGHGFPS